MKRNIGMGDRLLRIIIGIALLITFLMGDFGGPWKYILPIIAGLLIVTALLGVCGIYYFFGINTWQFRPTDNE